MNEIKLIHKLALLKNLIPSILDPDKYLMKREKEPLTGILYREALGVFLLCVVMDYSYRQNGQRLVFAPIQKDEEDNNNEDGAVLILNQDTKEIIPSYFEQVAVTEFQQKDITEEIINELKKKHSHYSNDYYKNHSLIIFSNKIGEISVKKIKDYLKTSVKFGFYGLYCLEEAKDGIYRYGIINLDVTKNVYGKFTVFVDTNLKTFKVING